MENTGDGSRFGKLKKFGARIFATTAVAAGAYIGGAGDNGEDHDVNALQPDKNGTELTHKITIPQVSHEENASHSIQYETVMQGIDSNITQKEDVVITNQEELERYWNLMNPDGSRTVPKLTEGEAIILTALGKSEKLRAVKVTGIENADSATKIFVDDYISDDNILSSPFDSARISFGQTPIEWIHNNKPGDFSFAISSSERKDADGNEIEGPQTVDITPK